MILRCPRFFSLALQIAVSEFSTRQVPRQWACICLRAYSFFLPACSYDASSLLDVQVVSECFDCNAQSSRKYVADWIPQNMADAFVSREGGKAKHGAAFRICVRSMPSSPHPVMMEARSAEFVRAHLMPPHRLQPP